ncbi:MAG: seryl-tRNA synthetase, partial [Acidimicrobiaceae bacterium]
MIDVRRIRADLEGVRAALARRGDPSVLVELDAVAELDERQRRLMVERDELRARIKSLSKDVGRLRKEERTDEAEALQAESRALGELEAELAARHDALAEEIRGILLRIPNLP